ncbi:hypothetical protein SynPROSU1_01116 [Synechococcus sp. PROS-U-1]|nr:hypothetical protein SynPROSU1_01116 [Synechococcus sp. PROS-U-1]
MIAPNDQLPPDTHCKHPDWSQRNESVTSVQKPKNPRHQLPLRDEA